MINIVKENANAEIDFPTLNRYKEIYSLLLSNYLREYNDNTEKRFIELQIEHYKTYCDEFLNNPKHTFNKWHLERFNTSRLSIIEYLENKLNSFSYYNNVATKHSGLPITDKANGLLEHLITYYRPDDNTKVKFVNILHYLKKDANKGLYVFKVKQENYKTFIKERFGIEIKKFAKSELYDEEEKPVLNSLEREFSKY